MNQHAKEYFSAQKDTLDKMINSLKGTHEEINEIYNKSMLRLNEISLAQNELNIEVNKKINHIENKVLQIDSSLHEIAQIFYKTSVQYQNILSKRESALLLLLSDVIKRKTGLPIENEGLFNYNLAVGLLNIGEYKFAIEQFKHTLAIQPELDKEKVADINKKIRMCESKLNERNLIPSIELSKPKKYTITDWLYFADALSLVLVDRGVLKFEDTKEIHNRMWDKILKK